jgi:hypothetical protein
MKRGLIALVVVMVAAAGACSLNPQPFPPDNPDGALSLDASKGGLDSSTFGDGAGNAPDASEDSAPVPQSEGGADADASEDALVDVATDAPIDAPTDAPNDTIDDVTSDVSTD